MNKKSKRELLSAVTSGNLTEVKSAFKKNTIILDESYFDLDLLKAAFKRNEESIIKFILYRTPCRAGRGQEDNGEESLLHSAIEMNNQYLIKQLINKGASIYHKNQNGKTPLMEAFERNNHTIIQALLTHSKPNCKPENKDAMVHFHIACVIKHITAVEQFLDIGFNPNSTMTLDSEEYRTLNPILLAAEKDHYPLFQKLLHYKGDLSIKNAKGFTPLHIIYYNCTTNSAISRFKQIFNIANQTKFINIEDIYGVTHFHLCCMTNDPDLVQIFIDKGVNINSSISEDCPINPGFTPLHMAVANNCEKVIELLLKSGADSNKNDKDGRNPLHWACNSADNKREQIIDLLIHYQSSTTAVDHYGSLPLHVEFSNVKIKNKYVFNTLMKISPMENIINQDGLSLFHIACSSDDIDRVKYFLDSQVNINDCVSNGIYNGYSAMHFAVLYNQKDVVELLLKKEAQVNVKTKEFEITPLHLACEMNYAKFSRLDLRRDSFPLDTESIINHKKQLDIIHLLISHGACVNAADIHGITPLLHTCMIDKNYCKLNWVCLTSCNNFKTGLRNEISVRLSKIVRLLCANQAEINVSSVRKETILHILGKYRSLKDISELLNFIVAKVVDIECIDDSGSTPLHVAVKASNLEMVTLLLERKANVNVKSNNSKIPLQGLFQRTGFKVDSFRLLSDKQEEKIFSMLLENGSDVNILVEERNKILLHVAIADKYTYMIEKLLDYGADINMEDSSGRSSVSTLLKWKEEGDNVWNHRDYVRVFQVVYIHVQKLLALGRHVSEKVQKICRSLYPIYTAALLRIEHHMFEMQIINLDNIFLNCRKELAKLKLRKIDNTSLYSVLLKLGDYKLPNCVRSDEFKEILSKEKKNFPLYYEFLKLQFRRATIRSELLPQAKQTIFSLINTFNLNLPDLCCDMIIQYLNNEDFANLIAVNVPKRSLKRKLKSSEKKTSQLCKRKKVK